MSTYAGADSFPEDVTMVDDATDEDGSSVDVPLEGTLDRTRWLKNRIQYLAGLAKALNFGPSYDAKSRTYAKYNRVTREWFGLSSVVNDDIRVTKSIEIWPSATSVPGPQLITLKPWDLDFNTAGDMMAVADGIDGIWTRNAAGSWTHNANGVFDPTEPNILFEPISGNWILASSNGATFYVFTDPTLSLGWTAQTPPTIPGAATATMGTDGAGAVVLQGFLGTNCYFTKSTDGGVTWSTPVVIALGFTSASGSVQRAKPVWTGSSWVALASDLSANTMVFTSPDGLSWSTVSLATPFNSIQCTGGPDGLLVMSQWLGTNGPHAFAGFAISVDKGATWKWADYTLPWINQGVVWIAWSGVRFALYTNGTSTGLAFPGLGSGLALGAVT